MEASTAPTPKSVKHRLLTTATLAGLVGVGYLGHHTGWSFSSQHAHAAPSESHAEPAASLAEKAGPPAAGTAVPNSNLIEFPSVESVRKSGVTTVPLETRAIAELVPATAVVTYDDRQLSRISTKVSGTVYSVQKRSGNAVKKGDLLAVVESLEIGRLKAEFLNNLAFSETRAETLKLLQDASASLPISRVREAELQAREANIRLANAEQTLINLGVPIRAADFKPLSDEQRAEKIHFLGFPETMTSEFNRETATTNLVAIVSPFDGIVISRNASVGEWTEPQQMLFEVADVRNMWLKLDVRKEDAARIRLGQPIVFRPDGMDEEIKCHVSWISTEVNQETRTLQVRADVENPLIADNQNGFEQRLLRANTFGEARIQVRANPSAQVVLQECVQTDTDEDLLFIKQNDFSFQAIPVELGVSDGEYVEVLGELEPGISVAHKGSHVLKSQMVLNRLSAGE
ncbi:efflux RND transporter periplasmic adaptor subunit [Planctomicrobium piriforme]|uniref:Multidrug efflux pump subunit AcrA (Membrane-fusion protein) n=1 Tax=Planctomicrobium piriforme TaxID=1576369 RepID=A0A1I3J887_9PLAN|nr:efflux RND transporter periplasmic adaptor subunit [Planctomicrobium piriforme]SFI56462.1 Multidrug efflux pump subunit AcrA (membrane-fusion protein) [Planctomicrobium piriforme]